MPGDDADRFRQQAKECTEQAAKAVSPLDKEAWLRVALRNGSSWRCQ
jgi:hypothetical protein